MNGREKSKWEQAGWAWENFGLLSVKRDAGERRDYREEVEWVKFIKRLKDIGMLLREIKNYSDLR